MQCPCFGDQIFNLVLWLLCNDCTSFKFSLFSLLTIADPVKRVGTGIDCGSSGREIGTLFYL